MVIKIHQVASTENAFLYNEKKVKEGVATFFDSLNTLSANPFMYDEKHRLKNLVDIEKQNPRVKNKCFHVSFNPSAEDYLKMGDNIIRQEISNMMKHMGYGNQPYFVYKHKDLERVHFHIVSTRIDHETGRKIKDNFEKKKMQEFIKNLEQKYLLTQVEKKEIPDFKFSPRSLNIKQNLENLFKHLNQIPEITSKEMYNEALKLFNVEIRKSGRGHIVVVTDDFGNAIRYPIRLSNFKDGPKFYKKQTIGQNQKIILNKMHQLLPENNRVIELTLKSIVLRGLLLTPETKANKKTTQIRNQRKYKKK